MHRVNKFKHFKKKNKYNAQTNEYNGVRYHSKLESKVAQDLDFRIKAGV